MKESTPQMGMNRTGMQMSPFDGKSMLDDPAATAQRKDSGGTPLENAAAVNQMRSRYIASAEPLGSVPVPGTVTGAVTTGMAMMTGRNPQMLIDKLGERLAFERTGTRLYEALLGKLAMTQDLPGNGCSISEEAVRIIHDQEMAHFSMVAGAIESIGGDPTAQTPCADLVGVESCGLIQVLTDPRTTLAQSLHAMQTVELSDNAGWEMLIALANDNMQTAMADEFRVALEHERVHLELVQTWLNELTLGVEAAQAMMANRNATRPEGGAPSLH